MQWLRDRMKFFNKASETEKIVKSLKSNNDIYLVPAFTGLGAPYWDANSRGVLSGITRDTSPKEIVRATIEAVAYQTHDLFEAMKHDGLRPKVQETTALGAAFMAGLHIGVYKSLKDISRNWHLDKKFSPKMSRRLRLSLLEGWIKAIKRTLIN